MTFTTTDEAIRSLMQRLASENLQMLAMLKLGYTTRQIDSIIQPDYKCPRVLPLRHRGAGRPLEP
jgi:hypothetical protein